MPRPALPRDAFADVTPLALTRPADVIAQAIRDMIAAGTLAAGDRLPGERELATRFGVGRSHVRDALRRLEFLGVLHTHPQSGTRVAEPGAVALCGVLRDVLAVDGTDIAALLETRVLLEAETARLAALRASADDRRAIVRAQEAFRTRAETGDPALAEDLAFHLAVAAATRNSVLASLVHLVAPDVMRHHGEQKTCDRARLVIVIAEHQAVCDAIAARDPARAAQAMTVHARMAREQYRRTPRARVVPVGTGDPATARPRGRSRAA